MLLVMVVLMRLMVLLGSERRWLNPSVPLVAAVRRAVVAVAVAVEHDAAVAAAGVETWLLSGIAPAAAPCGLDLCIAIEWRDVSID